MPLLGKRPYEPRPLSLRDLTHTDEVWVIRFTDEAFRSYEEYIERWEHYRQRVWTCRYTGRTGLTYEEALVSEADATHLSVQIPEEQLTEMALLMHKFVGGLEALVEHVQKHFRDTAKSGKTTTPTKAVIKQVVRIVADKEPYKGAPWMLKEDFCRKHNLTVSRELPPALMEARERYAERHKLDLGAAANGGEHNDENEPAADEASEPSPAKRSRVRKGPKDDLELEGADAQPPTPCSDFTIEQRYVGDMLMAFNFLSSYRYIELSPASGALQLLTSAALTHHTHRQKLGIQRTFTLGDFESALIDDDLCEFMEESLVRLLKSVDPNSSRITADTSDAALWKWLKASKLLDPSVSLAGLKLNAMKDQYFHTQSANVKIAILALLVRACLDSAATRQHLDESYETSLELQKEEKEQEEEEKQRERITAAFERKKKQTELNLEKMVAKLRAVPLGFDRHHRRYWFWPAAGPRLWVETPPASFYDSLSIPRPPSLQERDGGGDDEHKGEEDKRQNGSLAERMDEEETEAKATADKAEPKKETNDKKGKKGKEENGKAKASHMEEEEVKEKEDNAEEEDKESDEDEEKEKEESEEAPQEEDVDVSSWAFYDTIEQVDELIQYLNEEGPREKELKASLERKHQKILAAMNRTFHSTRSSQRVVMVPQYDLPVRRSSRIAGARPRR